jgi:tellurite resistance protein
MVTADPSIAPSPPTSIAEVAAGRLQHLPVTVFAVVMGLGGTAVAWQRASVALGAPGLIGHLLTWLALAVFAAAVGAYGLKVARHLPAVRAEWRHPVRLAFVPTASIALVILALALNDLAAPLAAALWWVGAIAQLALTLDVLRTWIGDPRFALNHVHPAWFIPVVGNLVVPLAGVSHAPRQVAWFFFSVGLVYWLAPLPVVLGRLVLGGVLPDTLAPTLAVQTGALRRVPFALSSWAYSFPLAAAASALLVAGHNGAGNGYTRLGAAALTVVSVLVAGLAGRTALAVRRGEICRPDLP